MSLDYNDKSFYFTNFFKGRSKEIKLILYVIVLCPQSIPCSLPLHVSGNGL